MLIQPQTKIITIAIGEIETSFLIVFNTQPGLMTTPPFSRH